VLVLFVLSLASILAVVGLLYSFGLILAQRRALQTAADAASLSGTWQVLQQLASDDRSDASVLDAVVAFAIDNGLPSDTTRSDATYLTASYVDGDGALVGGPVVVGSLGGVPFDARARGVQVTVNRPLPTVLPGFVKVAQVLLQNSATSAARPTTDPGPMQLVIPIGVSQADVRMHAAYDLFGVGHVVSPGQPPTLDLAASGAPSYGTPATNAQNWSDGGHLGAWSLPRGSGATVMSLPFDAIAAGLRLNITRQALPPDTSGDTYALVMLPVYDTSSPSTVHIAGFAQLKIRRGALLTSTSAVGTFVPYATAAYGTRSVPAPAIDFGAALVSLVS
jgi:putative Flp pilus-assembly TadE/G-like protein